MVVYYTGTGNSRYVAQRFAAALGDDLITANEYIKNDTSADLHSDRPWVFVSPTYGWQIQHIFADFLRRGRFTGSKKTYFVMTCGSEIGNADKYNRELCAEKAISCMGTAQIVMPENYIAMFNAPQAEEARQIVARAEPDIDNVIAAVRENRAFSPPRRKFYARFMSGPVNPIFYSCFVKASAFTVGNACTGCGQCVRRCPTNNITLQNGKPVWGQDCTHCMACICYCPAEAIEYGKKSLGKPRYHFEAL